MKKSSQSLKPLIRKKRAQLAKLRVKLKNLRVELAVLRTRASRPVPKNKGKGRKRNRPISKKWKEILGYIGKGGPEGMAIQDVMVYCDHHALNISKESFRSHMIHCGKKGWIERLRRNIFALTEEGAKAVGGISSFKSAHIEPVDDFLRR